MIFSVTPRAWDRSPKGMFTLLLLGQGFDLGAPFVDTVNEAWKRILSTPPFSDVKALDSSKITLHAYADQHSGDLGMLQNGNILEVDPLKRDNLRDYLVSQKIQVPISKGPPLEIDAIEVWPEMGRAGRLGSLVAVVINGNQPGELYQLTATPRYPVPLVAVVVTGENWHKPIVRAIGQSMGQLSDEFELDGQEFRKAPIQNIYPRPNVIVISDDQRSKLLSGARAQDVVQIPSGWGVTKTSTVKFHAHPGENPNLDTSQRAAGGGKLVEGGAGYRFNSLRCDFDCLMRRQPNSVALPIQAPGVEFCRACESALRVEVNNWQSTDLGRRPRILIDSQRLLCDMVRWKTSNPLPVPPSAPFKFEAGTKPKWSTTVDFDQNLGLRLQAVELKDRPGDPYAAATVVFDTIGFRDLKVKFEGEPEMSLSFDAALAHPVLKPELLELRDSTTPGLLAALRMRMDWRIPGHYSIEAVMSVVFKDSATDFDPGGSAVGNKLFPQLSMRYRKPIGEKGKLAKVESLSGSIHLVTGNVFTHNMVVHPDLHHMITGRQQVTLCTDSNSSDDDSKYDWDKEDLAGFLGECTGEDIPDWGTWGGEWKSGRLLADVVDPAIVGLPDEIAENFAGATARAGHIHRNLPGLPHWSWLFDYVTPLSVGVKRFVGVYRAGEMTPANLDGGANRELKFKWPVASDQFVSPILAARNYEMTVLKMGRQGAYDNVHIHPAMGSMNGRDIVPAPFCADLCIHVHVRWGTIALSGQIPGAPGTINRPQFVGWGRTGRLDQGAHTAIGAPLVPPNQHIRIEVNSQNTGSTITYTGTAHNPALNAYQVFLEQGTGVLYSFGGIALDDLANLAGGTRAINPRSIPNVRTSMRALQSSDPARLDRDVRHLFHKIYDRIRWYDSGLNLVKPNVQQVSDKTGAATDLENL